MILLQALLRPDRDRGLAASTQQSCVAVIGLILAGLCCFKDDTLALPADCCAMQPEALRVFAHGGCACVQAGVLLAAAVDAGPYLCGEPGPFTFSTTMPYYGEHGLPGPVGTMTGEMYDHGHGLRTRVTHVHLDSRALEESCMRPEASSALQAVMSRLKAAARKRMPMVVYRLDVSHCPPHAVVVAPANTR